MPASKPGDLPEFTGCHIKESQNLYHFLKALSLTPGQDRGFKKNKGAQSIPKKITFFKNPL
jgi:hypothetical protein